MPSLVINKIALGIYERDYLNIVMPHHEMVGGIKSNPPSETT